MRRGPPLRMHRGHLDANQSEIVRKLEAYGCSVQSLSVVAGGCPDIIVGVRGRNFLMELKDGSAPPSRQLCTEAQIKFIAGWKGQVTVVRNFSEALQVISSGAIQAPKPRDPYFHSGNGR